jgi:hypothetical protein
MWYEWDSLEDFNSWHEAKCTELNYPELDENGNLLTDAYTQSYLVEDKIIAFVEDEHSEGLTITELRIPKGKYLDEILPE